MNPNVSGRSLKQTNGTTADSPQNFPVPRGQKLIKPNRISSESLQPK